MAGKGGRRKTTWAKGQSGNPAGGRGKTAKNETWGDIIRSIGNMTGKQAASLHKTAADLANQGDKLSLKQLVVLRAYKTMLLGELSASLWRELMDREEGKVPQTFGQDADSGPIEFVVRYVAKDS